MSTQDGAHVLILCADGGVMYYHNKATSSSDGAISSHSIDISICTISHC